MVPYRLTLALGACLMAGLSVLSGCGHPQDIGVGLLITPEKVRFGTDRDRVVIEVNKTFSSTVVEPLIAKTDAPWLILENCTGIDDNCVVPLQGLSALRIPVTIDRNKTRLGTNRATIQFLANNAPVAEIEVVSEDIMEVNFDSTRQNIRSGQTVQFTDLTQVTASAGDISARRWDFGDGNTSNEINPEHRYTRSGQFDVTLTVTARNVQKTLVKSNYMAVTGSETVADFEVSAERIAVGDSVTFTSTSTSPLDPITGYLWDFGDGNTSTRNNPTHTYTASGIYTVSLTVTTARGSAQVVKDALIIVGQSVGPVARIGLESNLTFVNNPVQFRDLSDPGTSPITSREWSFGDGATSTAQNPVHTYRRTQTVEVRLTVTTAQGSDTAVKELEIGLRPPFADFEVDNTSPSVFEFIQFRERAVAGSFPIVTYAWDFGDGTTSVDRNPRHRYTEEGFYTVSLTVTTGGEGNNTATETKVDFIRVINPPSPDFSFTPDSVYTGTPVSFRNLTVRGTEPIVSYLWEFAGEGSSAANRSTQTNPTFTFTAPGIYAVRLTANTATRTVTICKPVVVDAAPVPNFTAAPRPATSAQTIAFTNTTQPGVDGTDDPDSVVDCTSATTGPGLPAKEIIDFLWDFGDGSTSTDENPEHRYSEPGTYTVRLTIGFRHSFTGEEAELTETKTGFMGITVPPPPIARFEVEDTIGTLCADPGSLVRFVNLSDLQGAGEAEYFWDFGDGNTSTDENPVNFYTEEGDYTVTLTVTTPEVFAPNNVNTATREAIVKIGGPETTALDTYVGLPDASFGYTVENVSTVNAVNPFTNLSVALTLYTINMTSQTWRSTSDYEVVATGSADWQHNVSIIVPQETSTNTSLLFVSGGNNGSSPPTFGSGSQESTLLSFAALTGSVITLLEQVPNQRIEFADEVGDRTRTEDEIIAYTFDEYLRSVDQGAEDETWPLLLPMVKSAVRAMDVVQDLYTTNAFPGCANCEGGRNPVQDFVVTGASKRGWTTWLTGAVDQRVKAIAPVVIDVLNMDRQMEHHFNAYGYWAPAIYPYAQERVFDRIVEEDAVAQMLLNIVDPFEYRCRLEMPKLILNSTGDQFFLPDSSQFYIGGMKGAHNLINYVPNTAHSLDGSTNLTDAESATQSLLSFYLAVSRNASLPEYRWDFVGDGSIVVEVADGFTPRQVSVWSASTNADTRDFRLDKIGAAWSSSAAVSLGNNRFRASVPVAEEGWTGFFVQLRFPNPAFPSLSQLDFVVSTPVRVLPETEAGDNLYPVFDGRREELVAEDGSVPFLVVHGTPNEMGRQQGRLLAEEIADTIPAFLEAAQAADPALTNQALDDIWTVVGAEDSGRFAAELAGMAQGSGIDVTLLRRANMVPVLSTLSGHAVAATRLRTGAAGTLQSTGIEWDPGLPLAPAIVLYVPTVGEGVPHANVGFAGLIGAFTGVNLGGVMVGAVQEADSESEAGTPITSGNHYTLFNRDLLYDALQLPDARAAIEDSNLIRRNRIVVSDSRARLRTLKARVIEANRPNDVIVWGAADNTDEFAPNVIPDGVYSISRADDAPLVFDLIEPGSGIVDFGRLFEVRDAVNEANTSENEEVVFVVYEAPGFPLRVTASYGGGEPVTVNLQDFLP